MQRKKLTLQSLSINVLFYYFLVSNAGDSGSSKVIERFLRATCVNSVALFCFCKHFSGGFYEKNDAVDYDTVFALLCEFQPSGS